MVDAGAVRLCFCPGITTWVCHCSPDPTFLYLSADSVHPCACFLSGCLSQCPLPGQCVSMCVCVRETEKAGTLLWCVSHSLSSFIPSLTSTCMGFVFIIIHLRTMALFIDIYPDCILSPQQRWCCCVLPHIFTHMRTFCPHGNRNRTFTAETRTDYVSPLHPSVSVLSLPALDSSLLLSCAPVCHSHFFKLSFTPSFTAGSLLHNLEDFRVLPLLTAFF